MLQRWETKPHVVRKEAGGAGSRGSDVIGLQWRKSIEGHGRVGRRVGAGALDQDLVADLKTDRQHVWLLLVEHVDRVAGRTRQNARGGLAAVARRPDRVADRLVNGLGEPAELADVE